jgi:DNA-binding transcriptional regulator YhcF (GntR family)
VVSPSDQKSNRKKGRRVPGRSISPSRRAASPTRWRRDKGIRRAYESRNPRPTYDQLAEEWGVSISTISRALRPLTWTQVYRGERHHRTRLTEEDVRGILLFHDEGETYVEIGRRYGITASSARLICKGERWGHLKDEQDSTRDRKREKSRSMREERR